MGIVIDIGNGGGGQSNGLLVLLVWLIVIERWLVVTARVPWLTWRRQWELRGASRVVGGVGLKGVVRLKLTIVRKGEGRGILSIECGLCVLLLLVLLLVVVRRRRHVAGKCWCLRLIAGGQFGLGSCCVRRIIVSVRIVQWH